MSYDNFPYTFRPIDHWPTAAMTTRRKRSPFRAKWTTTVNLLGRELRLLNAKNVVLQIAVREGDIRLDGKPRARALASHPGVILAFDSKVGPLKYAVDTFDDWQDNVRAIAMSLEKLRAVDRYGVTKRGEQYAGWRAIPQHTGFGFQTADEAARWMAVQFGNGDGDAEKILRDPEQAYRVLARRLHPDRIGGSHDEFVKLQAAKRLIEDADQAALSHA